MDTNQETTGESTAKSKDARPLRTRMVRKRTSFKRLRHPAWPVRGLWECAPEEEKRRAHATCVKILEYWLGKKSKRQVALEIEVTPLRVWQLSQQALAGMMAGLLTQPRKRVTREVFEAPPGESREELKRRVARLERELSRTEDLVRVLRTAPWANASTESAPKGGPNRAGKSSRRRKPKTDAERSHAPCRKATAGATALEKGASGGG